MDLTGFRVCHLDENIHDILYEKRRILGLTQKQVADRAKIVLQQYQKFENGERNIMTCSFQLACRIIEALEMDINKFYHGEYSIGEGVYLSDSGWRYTKTGELVSDISRE